MKNRFLLLALAVLSLASCTKESVEQINLKGDHVLTANIENAGPTKTTVENGGTKVLWGVGEEISVFLGTTAYKFKSLNTSPASSADFEGTPSLKDVSDSNPILALSPYKSGSKVASGIIYYNLPATQQAVENTYDPEAHALVAYSPTVNLSFYNVTSGIRFTLTRSDITEITLKSNDAMSLAGDLQIKASGSTPTIQNITSASTKIKLVPPAGGFKKGVWYYITTIPAKLTKGFTIDFKAGALEASFTTSSVVTMKRGGYGSISEIDKNLTFADPTVHVTGVTLDKTSLTMAPGETATLVATVAPENATDKTISWSSSDEKVATVDSNGKVTAKSVGTAVIVVLTDDGYKTATCNITVAPPVSDLRTQYAESASGYQTFGKVIHYKYGTQYGPAKNYFIVVPWGNGSPVEDLNSSHYKATSSNENVAKVDILTAGNRLEFTVYLQSDPTTMAGSFSDLTFSYTAVDGTKLTKSTRIVVAPSNATSAFEYEYFSYYYPTSSSTQYPDISTGSFTATISSSSYTPSMRSFPKFKGSAFGLAETKDMGTYTFTSSNTSVVSIQSGTAPASNGGFTFAEMNFKTVGTSNVTLKYTDYKGNVLNKTVKFTVNKNFIASGDYIRSTNSSYTGNNSTSNRDYVGVDYYVDVKLYKSSGQAYSADELTDITWSSSNTSVATVTVDASVATARVTGKAAGNVTITATGKDGSKAVYYMTVYKRINSITPNSTTYKIGLGTAHTMNYSGEDFTIVPSNATYQSNSDFKWKSSNSNVVSVGNTDGNIIGKGVGTATISAAPKPWYVNYMTVREVQVVDYRLKVTSTNSKIATIGTLYATNDVITVEAGSTFTVCFGSPSGTSYTWNGTCHFVTSSNNASIVTASGGSGQQYATINGVATGTTYIDLDYTGSNGRILQRYQVKVVPKFTWASGDIASNSASERPKTSPYWLTTDKTLTVYAYHGSSQYTASQAAALTWKSSNTNYATVSPSVGNSTVVTPKSSGLVEIIGTDSYGNTRSCWVQVYVPVTAIKGNSTPFYIGMGMSNFTHQMTYGSQADYTVTPSNATYTSPDHFNWSSSDESVATVGQQTGLVSFGTAPSSEKSAILKAIPSPNGKNVATTNVRTFQYVFWETYCYSSQDGGITSGKSFNGTYSNNVTVKKGSMSYLYIRSRTDSSSGQINFRNATYSITSSNTSVCKVSAYNPGTNNYVWISGSSTGTSNVVISINDGGHYFRMPFTVTVTD